MAEAPCARRDTALEPCYPAVARTTRSTGVGLSNRVAPYVAVGNLQFSRMGTFPLAQFIVEVAHRVDHGHPVAARDRTGIPRKPRSSAGSTSHVHTGRVNAE